MTSSTLRLRPDESPQSLAGGLAELPRPLERQPEQDTSTIAEGVDIAKVIRGDFCIGCGACAYVAPKAFTIEHDERGQLLARMAPSATADDSQRAARVCPFAAGSAVGENEDSLARRHFPAQSTHHAALGLYLGCYAGHVAEQSYREGGSSGGYITWLLCKLLERSEVDAILHVREHEGEGESLFTFAVSRSADDVRANAKSRYYPVTLAGVLKLVHEQPGRYAVTGAPCFIKAVRLLQLEDEILAERIKYCVGLVCGHLKSRRFADLLGWQLGIVPGSLSKIDFRDKIPDRPSSRYGVRLAGLDSRGNRLEDASPMSELIGGDWGVGYFKYRACEFCDDVMAETADVAVGDAWLPGYVKDSKGANVVVVRHPDLHRLTEQAIARGDLAFDRVDGDVVMRSQEGGLRDRRSGLAYRLHRAKEQGQWVPKKRVSPKAFRTDRWFRTQQDLRSSLVAKSHLAFERALAEGSLDAFKAELEPTLGRYYAHMRSPRELFRRAWKKLLYAVSARLNLSMERSYER